MSEWWRGAVIYQIYPRSFLDTNGDGVGDLKGITDKIPYIASLGVDGIWICPFFKSPMRDFGYDVSDYRDVDPLFGTMADFDRLMVEAKKHELKVIIDLVLSHTSQRHPWFMESRKNRDNPKADWYVWANPRQDGTPPNNWVSIFGGPAWTFEPRRKQYYMHNFLKQQPDLNFHNFEVQDAVLDIARFWLERGVDGFRLDTVNLYFHDTQLRDNPPKQPGHDFGTQLEIPDPYNEQHHVYDKSRPENLLFIKKFRKLLDEYGAFSVGEIGDDDPVMRAAEYTEGKDHLHTAYNLQMMSGAHKTLTPALIRQPIEEFLKFHGSWPSWAFSNHDVVRAASRWCPQGEGYAHDPALSKMLIALLGCLNGTQFLYQGEELGLPEAKLKFEELKDPWGIHLWPSWQGRDGCRTPMPWNKTENAGFSSIKPWLPIPSIHQDLTVADQNKDPESVLNFARKFLNWRKTQDILKSGSITFHDAGEDILSFARTLNGQTVNCRFHLSAPYHFEIEGWAWFLHCLPTEFPQD